MWSTSAPTPPLEGTVAEMARRAVGYIHIYIVYIYTYDDSLTTPSLEKLDMGPELSCMIVIQPTKQPSSKSTHQSELTAHNFTEVENRLRTRMQMNAVMIMHT